MPGHAVRVSIPVSRPRKVTAVPRDALVIRQKNLSVYRVNGDNIAEFVAVELGLARDELIEVRGDVAVGDRVVIRGNERLRPGQTVSIRSNES